MFGISDPGIWAGYLLSFILTAGCIAYGIIYWKKGSTEDLEDGS